MPRYSPPYTEFEQAFSIRWAMHGGHANTRAEHDLARIRNEHEHPTEDLAFYRSNHAGCGTFRFEEAANDIADQLLSEGDFND